MINQSKKNLVGLTITELKDLMVEQDESEFRGQQLFQWIYQKKATSFSQMTNISKSLRDKLEDMATIGWVEKVQKTESRNSLSTKFLFSLPDKHTIESVLIKEKARLTVCISSQVGCGLGCSFCETGKMRLKRNLTTGEIIDQVLYIERNIGKKITNVVFMGMGEPFQNYDNVIKAAKLINHPEGLAVGVNHIVISTAGIVPAIYRYTAEKHKFKLAISLQSAIDEKRKKLMPVTKTYPLARLIKAIKNYVATLGRRPTFEYVLIQGINDSDEDARALGALVNQIPCKINLIPYNPTGKEYKRPSPDQIDQFAQILMPLNAPVSIRWSKGDDVNAACGQLGHNFHKSKNNN